MKSDWKVIWDKKAVEDLLKIDKEDAELILNKVENYLSRDPISLGKPLKGRLRIFYRYRVGKYRVIYSVERKEVTIIVIRVGKRDKVYEKGL